MFINTFFNKKRNKTFELFDQMYKTCKDIGIVSTKEEFAKILEKPIINEEIDKILKSVENKIKKVK